MSRDSAPRLVAVGLLVALAGVLAWNAWHFPWRQGYDATASAHYAEVLGHEHRLPRRTETDVWHNPPLFFVVAGALYRSAETVDVIQPGRLVQLFSALCVLGIAALTFGLARELAPQLRWLRALALLLAVLTPVLVRSGALFHPEPLATLLTTAALYVVVRAIRRERLGWRAGLVAGGLLGLANLTRTWALAALAAVLVGLALDWLWRRDRGAVRALAGVGHRVGGPRRPLARREGLDVRQPSCLQPPGGRAVAPARPAGFVLARSVTPRRPRAPVPTVVPERARTDRVRGLVGGLLARVAGPARRCTTSPTPCRRTTRGRCAVSRWPVSPARR